MSNFKKQLSICLLFLLCQLSSAGSAACAQPDFNIPVSCLVGKECFIQNYFDSKPGKDYSDYSCGSLSYDGHIGTDFRLRDLSAMREHVAVIASAAGIVAAMRDGEPDINVKVRGRSALQGKSAGNSVRIDHGGGWETQYSHLLQGSVRVHVGQPVASGDVLGYVGLSGNTEFPHVDFTVRKDKRPVDPFNPAGVGCGNRGRTLWSDTAMASLRYQPTGLLISGFAVTAMTREKAENREYLLTSVPVNADLIAYWVELFGLRKDDRMTIELLGPDGRRLLHNGSLLPGDKALLFSFAGKRRITESWPVGIYKALFRLERAGEVVVSEEREIQVR